MKKIFMVTIAGYLFFILFVFVLLTSGDTGTGTGIPILATQEQAYHYQYIGSETGIPWDVVLLADIFSSQQNREKLEDEKPICTALQFCVVTEVKMVGRWVETEEVNADGEVVYELQWTEERRDIYSGLEEILLYLGMDQETVSTMDISQIMTAIKEIGNGKTGDLEQYQVNVTINSDYERILADTIGLTEENCQNIM